MYLGIYVSKLWCAVNDVMHQRLSVVLKIKFGEREIVNAARKVLENSIIGRTYTELFTYRDANSLPKFSTQICFMKNESNSCRHKRGNYTL